MPVRAWRRDGDDGLSRFDGREELIGRRGSGAVVSDFQDIGSEIDARSDQLRLGFLFHVTAQ